ncbi:putative transcription factor B3-Domain family [Helianthus annuus]|uniref:Transcription factor B3-Domain family n=1 Tax=Helianthus annuus TaxID=4232 RepID=A0A9K3DL21_HELAN|nr:putative transcription factor B3-Domain family [Helianthus annuus]KAJ0434254.1 putative transcription factor B3-Domain family [Helianthus annuus]KAJ0636776.1 putative transcription factor B3-Domain family [Helianthus annuus]
MNKADEVILCIPSDAACKLWGVDKAPTNVMIHTDDGRIFNVWLSESKGIFFFFQGWSNVTQDLGLSQGCLVVFNPLDCTTFKVSYFLDGVSGSSFWTCLLHTSSHFYVIPEVILPKTFNTSIDVISTIMIENKTFHVMIETTDGKIGFTVGIDVIVRLLQLEPGCFLIFAKYFGNYFNLKVFGKNGVQKNFSHADVDVPSVAPIDVVNEIYEEPYGPVHRFSRMANIDFMLPDRVSEMAKLDLGLKDITVRLLNRDPPVQFTNGTRRESKREGFRYALSRWSEFMKIAGIKVRDTVDGRSS